MTRVEGEAFRFTDGNHDRLRSLPRTSPSSDIVVVEVCSLDFVRRWPSKRVKDEVMEVFSMAGLKVTNLTR